MLTSGSGVRRPTQWQTVNTYGMVNRGASDYERAGDSGGASRFFATFHYCAKPSTAERNEGCERLPKRFTATMGDGIGAREHNPDQPSAHTSNHHPTVKSTALMQWLIRLITPTGGLVLDPFFGSGTTGKAATEAGFRFIGVEREPEYIGIAKERVKTQMGMAF